jgi:hypothetical protein
MNTSTAPNVPATPEEKKARIEEQRQFFSKVITGRGHGLFSYFPKIAFPWPNGPAIALFKSDLDKVSGFYTMIVNKQFNPDNGVPLLLYMPYDPNYAQKYHLMEPDKWAIPITEFKPVQASVAPAPTAPSLSTANLNGNSAPAPAAGVKPKAASKAAGRAPATKQSLPPAEPVVFEDLELHDQILSQMTIRDVAAIVWRKPVSAKGWLNQLIHENTTINTQ